MHLNPEELFSQYIVSWFNYDFQALLESLKSDLETEFKFEIQPTDAHEITLTEKRLKKLMNRGAVIPNLKPVFLEEKLFVEDKISSKVLYLPLLNFYYKTFSQVSELISLQPFERIVKDFDKSLQYPSCNLDEWYYYKIQDEKKEKICLETDKRTKDSEKNLQKPNNTESHVNMPYDISELKFLYTYK